MKAQKVVQNNVKFIGLLETHKYILWNCFWKAQTQIIWTLDKQKYEIYEASYKF